MYIDTGKEGERCDTPPHYTCSTWEWYPYLLISVRIITALLHPHHHTEHCWARIDARIPASDGQVSAVFDNACFA